MMIHKENAHVMTLSFSPRKSNRPGQRECLVFGILGSLILLAGCASTRAGSAKAPASLVWPDPPQLPKIEFVRSIRYLSDAEGEPSFLGKFAQGLFGRSREKLVKPYGVATDSRGRIYVADTAGRALYRFDLGSGKSIKLAEFEPCGSIDAQAELSFFGRLFSGQPKMALASPIGVAVDASDNFYVADSILQRVFAFDEERRCLRAFGGEEGLLRPSGIAISKDPERLYVTDTGDHKISVYSLDGDLLFEFGQRGDKPGEFNFPTNIFVDAEGKVYVSDSLNFRVQVFNSEGEYLNHFGRLGDVSGTFNKPKGIAVDSEGHIYVVDSLFDSVQIFSFDGALLLSFGESGVEDGEFWLPSGIFIDEYDNIYVSDSYNTRLQIFRYLDQTEDRNN
jgi:DNA-binding beta-propeller fold protein YncE